MVNIIKLPTKIILDGYKQGDCKRLETIFTIFAEKDGEPKYHLGIEFTDFGTIIPNMDLSYLGRIIGSSFEFKFTVMMDKYNEYGYNENPINLKLQPRNDVQRESIDFLLGRNKHSENANKKQLALNLNTGKGKTFCCVSFMAITNMKSIIIATNQGVLSQWVERMKYYTDIDEKNDVLMLNGNAICEKILNDKIDVSSYKVILVTHSTIRSFCKQNGWISLNTLFKKLKIGAKIYDEAHKDFSNMILVDFYTNVYKTIYVSASLNRSLYDEDAIFNLYIRDVPKITLFNSETDNRTDYLSIKFDSLPTHKERVSFFHFKYGLNKIAYIDYLSKNKYFYGALTRIMNLVLDKILDTDDKCLIYIGTNEAIHRVYHFLIDKFPYIASDIGVFTSIVNKDKDEQLTKKIILTTTKSAGEAIDIPNLKISIVLCEPFKSKVIAQQTFGRTRDFNTTYIELVDTGVRKIVNYYAAKRPVFDRFATNVGSTSYSMEYLNDAKPNFRALLSERDIETVRNNYIKLFKNIKTSDELYNDDYKIGEKYENES